MSKRERLVTKRVNIYDGQRITEEDLDTDQIHHGAVDSNMVVDFHGSGVVNDSPFSETILLDTRSPGDNVPSETINPSQLDIESGSYDGKGISMDAQPSDTTRGVRIAFELVDADIVGRKRTQIMIVGRSFDGIADQGELVSEFIDFDENAEKLSQHFYTSIIGVFFNNFSGGTGKTEYVASKDSLDLISDTNGYMVIKEAEALKVYPATKTSFQVESPNNDMMNFVTSSISRSISDEIELSLGVSNTINDMYVELSGKEKITFAKDGATSVVYGQKFLSSVNNLQKIDLLLSVERDESLDLENQFDFSGDIVISVHELLSEVNCISDAVPNDLIDFDPEITPLVETSFGQEDLEALGYEFNDTPQVVSFNFAGTLIADPNIEPSLESGKYYAFMVSRRGDNRTGTIILEKGYDKVTKKGDDSIPLTVLERFEKRKSKYLEYDPVSKRYINDSTSSLWFVIHTDAVEVVNGTAYTDQGIAVTVEKTEEFVGNTEVSHFERNINLRVVAEGSNSYVVLSQIEQFSESDVHPRTNNRVFTRILDVPTISLVNSSELEIITEDTIPVILARVNDTNVRDAQEITGSFDKPGLIGLDRVLLIDPDNDILSSNLVNRILTPDTDCSCNSRYRIARVDCSTVKIGDLNSDGSLTSSDLSLLLDIVGNTINSEVTERSILGGELDILDFIKSDMNDDGTVDGTDIELLEDAVDGYVNFSVPESIKVITLILENVLESSNNPVIFTDAASTGSTTAAGNILDLTTLTDNEALIIRVGDTVTIPAVSADSGTYAITSKEVSSTGLGVTLTVENLDETAVVFTGTSGFDVVITSGVEVNLLADNHDLTDVPFSASSYSIEYIEAPFESSFLNVCDLRRNVGVSFLELDDGDPCEYSDADCLPVDSCNPVYKNQTYLPGDLFLPEGNILISPGVPHPGDFEYVNIKLPLPPGSIEDCSLDLYNGFVKAESGTSLTASGLDAMKFSDGTMVGCQDSGTDTDITKGRVKFSHAVCSICVDALVDGYADGYIDGYTESESTTSEVEAISENFIDITYTSFDAWTENGLNDTVITNITHASGSNQPAIFELETASNSGVRIGRLDSPALAQDFEDDFIVDFSAARTTWDDGTLTNGTVSSFSTIVISNVDGSVSTLKMGWKVIGGYTTKLFYSGVIQNASLVIVETFSHEIEAPDSISDIVAFRFRRTNDVMSAYYIIPGKLTESTLGSFGQYVKIGTNPTVQPGSGTVSMTYEVEQQNSPTIGASFFVSLSKVIILSSYTSSNTATTIDIGKVFATGVTDRATFTIPFNLPRKTTILSAEMTFTADSTGTISDSFNIIPIDLLNSDNLGRIFNVPLETNASLITTFSPGSIVSGTEFTVDVTSLFVSLISQVGHLPGFIKGFVIEPDLLADSSFSVTSDVSLTAVYLDESTGVVFKVGVSIDASTGIATFNTKNIMFDALVETNRTVINFGVYLKKSGFINQDVNLTIEDMKRMGIGSCFDEGLYEAEEECFFITGSTSVGTFVEGPFPCTFRIS